MQRYHDLLKEKIESFPRNILRNVIESKLKNHNFERKEEAIDDICNQIISGNFATATWSDEKLGDADIDISLDKDDVAELERSLENYVSDIPMTIDKISDEIAILTQRDMQRRWRAEYNNQLVENYGFRLRLEERWGNALDQIRILLTSVIEIGQSQLEKKRKTRSKKNMHLHEVQARLHIRSCQIAAEIITLLENGFADGAMARWRTLYEVSIVFIFITEGGDEVARAYLDHRAVEVKKNLDEYERCHKILNFRSPSRREKEATEKAYRDALAQYGNNFSHSFGWAANHLKLKKPDFKEIEAAVQNSGMRSFYKMASHSIHAGTQAIYWQLGQLGSEFPIAGRSNAGLADPGQNTALSLCQITVMLFSKNFTLDDNVHMKTLNKILQKAQREFIKANRRLLRDHRASSDAED